MSFLLYKRSKTITVMGRLYDRVALSMRYMIHNYGHEDVFLRSSFISQHNLAMRTVVNFLGMVLHFIPALSKLALARATLLLDIQSKNNFNPLSRSPLMTSSFWSN